jgi:hypothetical protein
MFSPSDVEIGCRKVRRNKIRFKLKRIFFGKRKCCELKTLPLRTLNPIMRSLQHPSMNINRVNAAFNLEYIKPSGLMKFTTIDRNAHIREMAHLTIGSPWAPK